MKEQASPVAQNCQQHQTTAYNISHTTVETVYNNQNNRNTEEKIIHSYSHKTS